MDARYLQKFFDSLEYSDEYRTHIKSLLNQMFAYAEDKNMIKESLLSKVKIIKKAKTLNDIIRVEDKYLEIDEAEALIKRTVSKWQNLPLRSIG